MQAKRNKNEDASSSSGFAQSVELSTRKIQVKSLEKDGLFQIRSHLTTTFPCRTK